ncbi:MAG: DUF3098 domain-containing protein [Chitinophagales bacterium]
MAKNQPKTNPVAKPVVPQVKSTVKQSSSNNSSWLKLPDSQNKQLLFNKTNYILMAVSALLIIIGFAMMSGGNTDPKVFNVDEIYSPRRITWAPLTIIFGFVVMVVAILKKPEATTAAE